jgi:hypothetical protein
MENNRSKIQNMTNQERRNKNKSNMSVQPPNSHFLSFTMESGLGISKDQKSKLNNTADDHPGMQNFNPSNSRYNDNLNKQIDEEYYSESSNGEVSIQVESDHPKNDPSSGTENSVSTPGTTKDHIIYKRNPETISTLNELKQRAEFYMNAPRQIDINKLREKVDLPPLSIKQEDTALSKNTPKMSNTSKLMQQLQQKKMMTQKHTVSKLASPMGPNTAQSFTSYCKEIVLAKERDHSSRNSQQKQVNSALAHYSKESAQLKSDPRNTVFTESNDMTCKQFLTFTAPTQKKKERKQNKSAGSDE